MYSNGQSSAQVNGSSSEPFKVTIGLRQGSVLSPLLSLLSWKPYEESLKSVLRENYYILKILQS